MKHRVYQLNILIPDVALILMFNKWLNQIFTSPFYTKHNLIPKELSGIRLLSERTQVKDQDLILFFLLPNPLEEQGKEIYSHIVHLFEREKHKSPFFLEWRKRTNSKDPFFYIQSYKEAKMKSWLSRWIDKIRNLIKRK
ncbi:MAG TPA: hypothetical protein VJ824_04565 [Bacillota bacterium]|nr:hypothetical protein [Bacillota bacterium]